MRLESLFLLLFLFGCSSSSVPGDIIQPEKMKVIVFDLIKADELVNSRSATDTTFKRENEIKKYYEQVFLIHNTNHTHFYKSYNYYQAHPNINKVLFDSLTTYANRKRAAIAPPVVK